MEKIGRKELIKKHIEFFKSKGHKEIPNFSLIPANDPTVLFTTAGMHPLVPYLLGQKHPLGKRLVNVQRCIRTGDIDEVGDTFHHTFFEMLGNWSLGDYFKEEAIKNTFEFQTKVLGIPKENYAVTVFAGNKDSPKDEESEKFWLSVGISKERIAFLADNWWGPAGATGPCGPDTEQFFWSDKKVKAPKTFNPENSKWVEIGNDVLMQYVKDEKGNYNSASQKNIDFGGGVERTVAALNGLEDNYLADMWKPIIERIEKLSEKKYGKDPEETKAMRIIADHIKAAVFIIADGIVPKNTEQGYVLRRLIRRAIRYGKILGIESFTENVAEPIFKIYDDYETLKERKTEILKILAEEEANFNQTITKGLHIFHNLSKHKKSLSGEEAFLLYQSYGFPFEMTLEMLKEEKIKFDEKNIQKSFETELKKHQQLSRTAAEGKFKSGLADNSEQTTRLHTATHMLNAALKEILKNSEIHQKGSNITPERLRFDFNFPRKLTDEEIKQIEDLINKKIKAGLEVKREEMSFKDAEASGAEAEFGAKYPEKVSVYTILDPSEKRGFFSREICTGPHVNNTSEIGHFKIKKEESSSAGVRRIKAVVE